MRNIVLSTLIAFCSLAVFAQDARQQLLSAERDYSKATEEIGVKQAALRFFAADTVIFRPEASNGREFWNSRPENSAIGVRTLSSADISANGLIGYTTGGFELFPKGQSQPDSVFGQYVTIWGRREGNTFRPVVEMTTRHDKSIELNLPAAKPKMIKNDPNKRNRSAADPSMYFLRMSMGGARLGGAYKQYAADEIRFLRDGLPPIIGKKRVAEVTKDYRSVRFPFKVALIESGDMAYSWNPCQYTNNEEGMETGNCLHVWKLRNKKWWIVLGAFARAESDLKPQLRSKQVKAN